MRIFHVVGARPNFMKISPMVDECARTLAAGLGIEVYSDAEDVML